MKMGRQFIILSSIFILLSTFLCFIKAAPYDCTSFKTCTPLYAFIFNSKYTGEQTSKSCEDACATYICIVNGAVIYGGGCYSDFEAICTGSTLKPDIKNMENGKAVMSKQPGNVVYTCKKPHCVISYETSEDLRENNYLVNTFKDGFTSNPIGCHVAPPSNLKNGLMNQMNGFQLFGMALLGFLFAQFW
uniref:Uncharacterized protein n=1 Tax=Panagrolaimus sp. ES5 TaxID=591445 RepID=A0AC34F056_9BILA